MSQFFKTVFAFSCPKLCSVKRILQQCALLLALPLCFTYGGSLGSLHAAEVNADKADFYVATNGSDTWSGKLDAPDSKQSDGPFATLTRARDAVRELKRKEPTKNITVMIRGGRYEIKKTVVFGLEDSGDKEATIAYEAYPNEKPILSSATELVGWMKVKDTIPNLPDAAQGKVWVADVSEVIKSSGRFYTLYDGRGRLPRARSEGFIPDEGNEKAKGAKVGRNGLRFPEGTIFKNWSNVEDVELVVRPHHAWVVNILPLTEVDLERRIARTSVAATYAVGELHYLKGTNSCWVENALEALDEPGEWVLNTEEGKVYLWTRDNFPPSKIMAPTLLEYIRVEGKIDEKKQADVPVQNLHFRGLTFMHGKRYVLENDDKGLQHDWDFQDKATSMLRFRGAENCVVENCHFSQSGGSAVRFDLHAQGNQIINNHIENVGAAGILIAGYGPGTKDVSFKNLVSNNHIHNIGEVYGHSPGIFLWQSGENLVTNNLIHHAPYAAVIVSGVMTEFFAKHGNARELLRTIRRDEVGSPSEKTFEELIPFLHSHDNQIVYNEIHHVMELLADGNAIYIRGAGPGNIIGHNYIHHLVSPIVMQSAIRTDGGQKDTLIVGNLLYKCGSHGIKLKLNNRAENNIIADMLVTEHKGKKVLPNSIKMFEGPATGGSIKRNIFYSTKVPDKFILQGKTTRGRKAALAKDADTDFNIYYCAEDPSVGVEELKKSQKEGVDKHSLAVDPLFVDAANGDFRLKPESPALKLGFVPIDLSKVGLLNKDH
ncbi:MAG: right-handed parallel beta-helix repeat-containing protein [Akkermansiaceae bacterium]